MTHADVMKISFVVRGELTDYIQFFVDLRQRRSNDVVKKGFDISRWILLDMVDRQHKTQFFKGCRYQKR